MSAEAAPPPTPPDSLIYKLSYTPLRDVLRGTLTARLDLDRMIATANLPLSLSTVVETTVKRTRLRWLEKVDVMRELIAHFQEGLNSGASAECLAASFGDIVVTANLIRRAKTRQRIVRRMIATAVRWTIRLGSALLALALIVYLIMAVRVYTGSPRIEHDYVADFNAPTLAIPVADRAWTLYRNGFLALTEWPPPASFKVCRPGTNGWEAVSKFTQENQAAVSLFRLAAQRPALGAIIADPEDADVLRRANLKQWIPADSEILGDGRPALIAVVLPEVAVLSSANELLIADAYLGIASANRERVAADLIASLRICEHLATRPFLISKLVTCSTLTNFGEALAFLLTSHPRLLTDEQLKQILAGLQALAGPRKLAIDRSGERAFFDDVVQRVFTDDGHGDGVLSPLYLPLMKSIEFVGQTPSDTRLESIRRKLQLPVTSLLHAGKRATRAKYDELMDRMAAEQDKPLWELQDCNAEQAIFQLHDDQFAQRRYELVARFIPATSRAAFLLETAIQRKDACVTAIALELYQRANAGYPKSLDELVPHYLRAIPLDRYDGRRLKYKLVDGKPLLYSVGRNREDDNGTTCKAATPVAGNRIAFEWTPPALLPTSETEKAKIRGDWILWPPIGE